MAQTPALKTQRMHIGGMDCQSCAGKIETRLQQLAGVSEVSVSVITERLTVSYNPQQVSEAEIQARVKALGYSIQPEPSATPQALEATAGDIDCSGCDSKITPGHSHSRTSHSGHSHSPTTHPPHSHSPTSHPPTTHSPDSHHFHDSFNLKQELPVLLIVTVLFALGLIFEEPLHNTPASLGEYAVFIPAYLISGWSVLQTAGRNILRGQMFDENFLMAIATLGAIAIHKIPEAVGVMVFYKVGELFQSAAVSRSRRSIQSLLEIRPDAANLQTNDGIRVVAPEQVQVGDWIVVKPGERVPLDGTVVDGRSQADTSALTGESVPRSIHTGEPVLAGMINQSGVLTVRVTKRFSESSIARILDLVENASSKKSTTEKFITRFAQRYTPIVVFLSLAVALLPPLVIPGATHAEWVYRALILLVISCPCGLVISIPLGYFGGVGGAAKRGILVKGSTFLDTLAAVKTVVFDKTGTLTQGVFQVTHIMPQNGWTPSALLQLAALVETHSNHPIAQSIRAAYGQPIDHSQVHDQVRDYVELAGYGVQANVNGQIVMAGGDRLLDRESLLHHDTPDFRNNPAENPENSPSLLSPSLPLSVHGTVVHIVVDRQYAGQIIIADQLKADAVEAVQRLKTNGIQQTVMLTGDNPAAAQHMAQAVGIDRVVADLLPEGKVAALEAILAQAQPGEKVAFVGDGINDAPVLARADVGIAMGALGADAAIETADVVLMTDAPTKVVEAIQIGRKTLRIVWQNIIFAMAIKGLFIALGIFGVATMWEAVFADMGVALMAIVNAMRVLR
ncbi:MAG TPA: heavy metal translocating P-type ATPase [Chroococcidiopsis sp.]